MLFLMGLIVGCVGYWACNKYLMPMMKAQMAKWIK